MVVGADGRTDGRTDRQTDTQNFGGYNIIPRHFLVAGHKNEKSKCTVTSKTCQRIVNSNWTGLLALLRYTYSSEFCANVFPWDLTDVYVGIKQDLQNNDKI